MIGHSSHDEAGFTLVEMLVALTIFALLAAAGVGLLRSSVDTQGAVERRLTSLSATTRLHALLTNDLSNAVARPVRRQSDFVLSFTGSGSSLSFLRSGGVRLDDAGQSSLHRVEWRLDGQALNRIDAGAGQGAARRTARLLGQARQVRFRYRAANGGWSDSFVATAEEPLPQAVEMVVTRAEGAPLTAIVALPASGVDGAPVPQFVGEAA